MRLLIDECLSPELARMAHAAGYEASHIVRMGLSGYPDRDLMPTVIGCDWTFGTKNSADFRGSTKSPGFRGLHAEAAIHAGLICLNGPPGMDLDLQRELFDATLDEPKTDDDLVNLAPEITVDGDTILSRRYAIPLPT